MKTKTARLVEQIESMLDSWRATGGRLPAVRILSERLKTSPVTLLRALNELLERKALQKEEVSGRYYVEGYLPERKSAADEFIPRHERIAAQIRDQIIRGSFGKTRRLPSIKQLQNEFGCAKKTAFQTYAILEKQGLVRTHGRSKVIVNDTAKSARVVLAGAASLILPQFGQYHPIIESIEQELATIGWGQLQLFLVDNPHVGSPPSDHEVAGYIFLHVGTHGSSWRDFFAKRPDIRCVTLDPSQEAARIRVHRQYYRISIDNTQVGRDIARHAINQGHRRAAFISHLTPSEHHWLSYRWQGVDREFYESGGKATLHVPCEPGADHGQIGDIKENLHALNSLIGQLQKMKSPAVPDIYYREMLRRSYELRDLNMLAARLTPLYSELLESDATIWICCNDHIALLAQNFLANRQIRIGQEISLAGFDNLPFAHSMGVTSYHFPYAEMGRVAVHCLANPRHLGFDKKNLLHVVGKVIGRPSVGVNKYIQSCAP